MHTLGFARLYFLELKVIDLVDMLLVALIIYQLIRFMQGTAIMRVFFVFVFIYVAYLLVVGLKMELLSNILGQFTGFGIITIIVLFQQEIRRFLFHIGHKSSYAFLFSAVRKEGVLFNLREVVEAVMAMSAKKTGALLLLSRKDDVESFMQSGSRLDAEVSKELLLSIFNKASPLHDGAVIIHRGKLKAAACILPISERSVLPSRYGTRHRVAVDVTEHTDIISLVVSEETGEVALAFSGRLRPNVSEEAVTKALEVYASGGAPDLSSGY